MADRFRPSPALVISMLALMISISGVAVALPGTNTVNSGDIVNGTIKSIDLKDDEAVASEDVIDGTLGSADVGPNQLTSADLALDSVTSAELANGQVLSADLGAGSVKAAEIGDGVVLRLGPIVEANAGTPQNGDWGGAMSIAECESGEELVSGGARFAGNEGDDIGAELAIGELDFDTTAETVKAIGLSDIYFNAQFRATAMCMQE
jgi:hypothetical protein